MNDELVEFSHLWDGSEQWGLSANHWTHVTLTAVFSGASPSVGELMALRRLRPDLRAISAHELKTRLHNQREVELGRFDGMEAHEIEADAEKLGVLFSIRSQGESGTHYLPVQRIGKDEWSVLLIEDDALLERVTNEMLRRGVPVVEVSESA